MTQHDFIRLFVLSEIADDYEEPPHIYENVSERSRTCGITVELNDVQRLLTDLVESGLAKSYDLWVDPPSELDGVAPLDRIQDYHFLITEKKRKPFRPVASGGHLMRRTGCYQVGLSQLIDNPGGFSVPNLSGTWYPPESRQGRSTGLSGAGVLQPRIRAGMRRFLTDIRGGIRTTCVFRQFGSARVLARNRA